jgi:hypothetical protein
VTFLIHDVTIAATGDASNVLVAVKKTKTNAKKGWLIKQKEPLRQVPLSSRSLKIRA